MSAIPIKNLVPGTGANMPLRFAGVPVDGAAGTYAGRAPIGVLLVDTVNSITYQNGGTALSPTWNKVGAQT